MPDFWSTIWNAIWWFLLAFVFIAYLMALFAIITDLVRDRSLRGILKALWLIFLVFLPFLTAVIYLIARGSGIAERTAERAHETRRETDDYIRQVTGTTVPGEISEAKQLLDSGVISHDEFELLKASALRRAS
ncbi:PLDc N-terminal domain-containing protein [Tessaracoccus palaemonis]|uniref:PLDc N-terminal domain-containing protein n=1 Tax=Tessaracoccus palaemonis TaxID=2829499 RepID=A0ABX8SJD3_9ACTN|nr:PLDc N-terminal domain-containing protein [Tessaracoccus palaemonis]QXT62567.1 PLDc N-terminal domain-containing protein [Tessaracoccus palaemonis]